ncbi:MAG: bifunctional GTP diphosphokinase/guanosine-3',5'-bis pyrophosphate 3'-pyrophosphohydrolase [Moritella sp.]|uniref:bifunctional GTP diphosphokinase/guanosine-3',5'-bis pyrophosphate 3'-pyrophosphohydrolase n=1 Tax=unclassified Moritella TaxID=2637987 RepID=UPI0001568515|nr:MULTISPECIES: bifunctional GTP diphosphokinase/guanosine-3',5'-bis pyrophosphate 3'-pyrophosphohydrolase [unclassified Moritella]EDM68330.1 guanosine-3',5'-bis(diphosphate) 3'-pyrophosphohydrolase [Moritella sp. PE36]MBL1417224.1 bifunctional GTP diphosphokinase/guanosine-3',5'-bis pyrophosphate 3'-pyrophosphohydrolase [Moritella sp.]
MHIFANLKATTSTYLSVEQVELIEHAYLVAREAHLPQKRSTGEPYIIHPVAVAEILAEMRLDHKTIMAALLHDVIEDTPTTQEDLASLFGSTVAELVEGVSKLDKLKFRDRKEAQAENFRKMFMAMVQDIRVILIKLADRTHNMRTIGALRPDKRRRIASETLEIFAPIANRLGIHNIKNELEELGLEAMYPMRYRILAESVKSARGNRKEVMSNISQEIEGRLAEAGVPATTHGREKLIFSIYNKMKKKRVQFHEVVDIYAFRIIVEDLDTCYRVLGQMHSLYKPKITRFKDYIAIPKTNGYQSLHTSLVGPHGVPLEIQIRTKDMDLMADRGVAAHWSYKQGADKINTTAQLRAQKWMQSLLELQQSAGSSFEFIESVKTDLFPDEIYVFTPKGKIIELPRGATPVDVAYSIHTDVGHTCVGARVNRQPHALSQPLKNGQTVEIITAPGARPNAAWLNFIVTGRARASVRQQLKNMRTEDSIILGRRLLNHALNGVKIDDIAADNLTQVLADTKCENLDALLIEIGLGNMMSIVIARRLQGRVDELTDLTPRSEEQGKMPIKGAEGMLVSFANCCHPIPGDAIVAHLSPGKGLVIHIETCRNIHGYQNEPDRYIPVEWDENIDPSQEFKTEIRIQVVNHQGVLAKLTNTVASTGANIHNIVTDEKDARVYNVDILITAKNRKHVADVMKKIRTLQDVLKISRSYN